MFWRHAVTIILLVGLAMIPGARYNLFCLFVSAPAPSTTRFSPSDRLGVAQIAPSLPPRFIANAGQTDPDVRFTLQEHGLSVFFTPEEVVLAMQEPLDTTSRNVVRLHFPGANPTPTVEGLTPLPGGANFFLGDDPAGWQTNVPTFGGVAYRNLYPGVDLVYRWAEGRLKSDFLLSTGVDPATIRLAYTGVENAIPRADGALVLQVEVGELIEEPPTIYQIVDGRRQLLPGGYKRFGATGTDTGIDTGPVYHVGFWVGAHDPALPLVIDPALSYATYLGGSGDDEARDVALDSAGNAYLTGWTASTDFPTRGTLQTDTGGYDVFVTQIVNASGVYTYGYSTYLGGSGYDAGTAIAVDSQGSAYVTGVASSSDFPIYREIQPDQPGWDVFVTQIVSATGVYTLGYSTYLGGSGDEDGLAIAVDGAGNAYVTGWTQSSDFFTHNATQADQGSGDAFVTQIVSATGVYTLGYSTYLGGSGWDDGSGIAVDGAGNIYVTGETQSSDFPIHNALQTNQSGPDAFVTQLTNSGGIYSYGYSTYLGGSGYDEGAGIVVDSAGTVTIVGTTQSSDFPTRNPLQTDQSGPDVFVARIGVTGGSPAYEYSTYLGGGSADEGLAVALDDEGNAYVTGWTTSSDFPIAHAFQTYQGGQDAFVTQIISATGVYTHGYSTFLGGTADEEGWGIAAESIDTVYVTGRTWSSDFPTHNPSQPDQGGVDGFVVRFDDQPPSRPSLVGPADGTITRDADPVLAWDASPSPDAAGYLLLWNGAPIDVGNTTTYIPSPLADGVYTWTVAAYDGAGNLSPYAAARVLSVDTTAPIVIDSMPNDGAVDVPLTAPAAITFSEPISAGTFVYSTTPASGGWSPTWHADRTAVTLTHAELTPYTTYTITVTSAADRAGNGLSATPHTWQFTTTPIRQYLPLVVYTSMEK